jgi:sugar-phosphatase
MPSADLRLATVRLGAVGIEPEVLVTVDDVARGKPDPEGYLTAAKILGVLPGRCLVVEDSPAGVMAGQSSGALVAAVKGLEADIPLNDLSELAELVTESSRP